MVNAINYWKNFSNKQLFWKALCKSWLQFSQSTGIQGVKYISDPKEKFFVRCLWVLVLFICILASNALIATFYLDFMSNPTRMNIETNHAPLVNLHFPTVTICSANYLSYIKVKKFVHNLILPENVTEEVVIGYIFQTTGFRMNSYYKNDDLYKLQSIIDLNRFTTKEFMSQLRSGCDELLYRCSWQMIITECKELFQVSLTYNGNCCSFNINQAGIKFLNKYARIHGVRGGISTIVRPLLDDLAVTTVYSNGFKLLIHKSHVFPNENTIERIIPTNTITLVRIRPSEITCSDQVRQLLISDRDCAFPEERKLKFFTQYDDENCDFECQILSIVDRCKCVPYFFFKDTTIPTCNFTAIPCLVDNYELITVRRGGPNYGCDCPANCQDVDYDVQTNAIPLFRHNLSVDPFYDGIRENDTVVHVYLGAETYRRFRRDLLSNFITLIANLGSTYSLFLGLSIVSIIEVFYFFTIVLRRNYLQMKKESKQLPSFKRKIKKQPRTIMPWDLQSTYLE